MLRKKDYETELAKIMGELKKRKDHSREELDAICRNIPICVMQNGYTLGNYCMAHNLSFTDSFIILAWVVSQFPFLNDIKVSNNITYDDACKYYETARLNSIVIHRLNYIMHDAMTKVYDILDRDNKIRFKVKKDMNNAEKVWNTYLDEHRKGIERSAWFTMLDHLRLASDAVSPYTEKVYEAIRDDMIRLGMRDVETKAYCQVALLLVKVNRHSYKAFFRDFERESGADYTKCFDYNDLTAMVTGFVSVCNDIGIKTDKDQYGYDMMRDYDPEKSLRFKWAWRDFINALRDDDLVDQAAVKAIGLNPEMQQEYKNILEKKEREHFEDSVGQLSEKFKVGKL